MPASHKLLKIDSLLQACKNKGEERRSHGNQQLQVRASLQDFWLARPGNVHQLRCKRLSSEYENDQPFLLPLNEKKHGSTGMTPLNYFAASAHVLQLLSPSPYHFHVPGSKTSAGTPPLSRTAISCPFSVAWSLTANCNCTALSRRIAHPDSGNSLVALETRISDTVWLQGQGAESAENFEYARTCKTRVQQVRHLAK